jgi:hypothetical protein
MKRSITVLAILISLTSSAQLFRETKLDTNKLPKGLSFEGNIKTAVRWVDEDGDNIVITTETGEHPSKTEKIADYRDAELFACHFMLEYKKGFKCTWQLTDFIKACPMDIEAKFIKNTFALTDLDSNGVAEIWLMYKTVCHGDVSPSNMKLIMYQRKQKYAMRGRNKVEYEQGKFDGGEYTFDKAFTKGPPAFIDFAKHLWDENSMQTWD